jgi:choline kinase
MSHVDQLVIACAGVGSRLGLGLPKALIDLDGQTLIRRLLKATAAVQTVRVVVGFQEEDVMAEVFRTRPDAVIVRNPAFLTTSTLTSFARGAEGLRGKTLFMDGDLVITPQAFEDFRAAAALHPSLYGHCEARSEDPVYAHLDASGQQLLRFSRTEAGPREWASVFCCEPQTSFHARPLADQRSGSVFEWLQASLPLPATPIEVAEVDTPADLQKVREHLRALRPARSGARPRMVLAQEEDMDEADAAGAVPAPPRRTGGTRRATRPAANAP